MHFIPQKHPKILKILIFIWEKATFFFKQLFPVVARTWLGLRSVCFFLGPKFRGMAEKSDFCHTQEMPKISKICAQTSSNKAHDMPKLF